MVGNDGVRTSTPLTMGILVTNYMREFHWLGEGTKIVEGKGTKIVALL